MSHISKVTDVITFPARTALGAARLGIRTTGRVLGWAAEQVVGQMTDTPVDREPAGSPPVGTPPVSTPPVSTPPVSTPPMSAPPVST
ncbi:MAG TPA: hypothetical protein VGV65_13670, partial [Nocardioides sp.]|nr:hypothetical protein [Nocardioides sp.]